VTVFKEYQKQMNSDSIKELENFYLEITTKKGDMYKKAALLS